MKKSKKNNKETEMSDFERNTYYRRLGITSKDLEECRTLEGLKYLAERLKIPFRHLNEMRQAFGVRYRSVAMTEKNYRDAADRADEILYKIGRVQS